MYIDSVLHNNLQHMFQNKEIRCSLKMQYEFLTPAQTRSFGRGTHWCKVILGLQPICARFEIMHETTKSNLKLYTQIFIDVNQVVICGSYKSYMSIFLNRTYMIDFMIFILNHLGTNPAYFWLRTRWFMYYPKALGLLWVGIWSCGVGTRVLKSVYIFYYHSVFCPLIG